MTSLIRRYETNVSIALSYLCCSNYLVVFVTMLLLFTGCKPFTHHPKAQKGFLDLAGWEPGHINISSSTYEQVKVRFNCTYRGKIEAKNKGMIDMYYVE